MKRRRPNETSSFPVAHFRRPVEGVNSLSQERYEEFLQKFPARTLIENLAKAQSQNPSSVDIRRELPPTVFLDENIEKLQNQRDLTRAAKITNLSQQFTQAASKYCSTEAERSQFLTDFIKEVLNGGPPLPDAGPELFKDRNDRKEVAPDFIKRVYATWLGKGLTQPDLYRLDKPLYVALHNWLRKNPMPPDLDLPSKHEALSRELASQDPDELRDKSRLSVARWRRDQRNL